MIFHLLLSSPDRQAKAGVCCQQRWPKQLFIIPGEDGQKKKRGEILNLLHASIIPQLEWSFQEEQSSSSQSRVQKKMNEGIDPFTGLSSSPPTSFLLLSWHKSRKQIFYLPLIPSAGTKVFPEWSHHSSISVTITPVTHRLHDSFRLKASLASPASHTAETKEKEGSVHSGALESPVVVVAVVSETKECLQGPPKKRCLGLFSGMSYTSSYFKSKY